MASKDWSGLPLDLLGAIINRLPIPCCLRVRAVCRSWSLASAKTPYRPGPTNRQFPWLVATEEPQFQWPVAGDGTPSFYSVSERRSYHLNVPAGSSECLASSSYGWLVFANEAAELHLLNPITGVRFPLPSVTTFPGIKLANWVCDDDDIMDNHDIMDDDFFPMDPPPRFSQSQRQHCHRINLPYYRKVKVFTDSQNIKVFVFHARSRSATQFRLSYASAGDETWIEIAEHHCFTDLADFEFHKGKLYGVFRDGRVVVIDNLYSSVQILRYFKPRWFHTSITCLPSRETFHLLDSVDGKDLLLVIRRVTEFRPVNPKSSFLVLKLSSAESKWVLVPRLEETAIFFGGNTPMALSTHGLPELKENCIYFTDGREEEGVFHLDDWSISPLCRHDNCLDLTLPSCHWFIPTL